MLARFRYPRRVGAQPSNRRRGHYWFTDDPAPLAPNAACLDYSIAKGGRLCAYRWDGEPALDASKFVWVAPNR